MSYLPVLLAYLDPGSGAILIQILIAALVTTGMVFRQMLWAPLAWFTRGSAAAAKIAPVATTNDKSAAE